MRILMLTKCKSCPTSWEVRTLSAHTDKKYTVTCEIVWRTGTVGQPNAAATGFRSAKLCATQGQARKLPAEIVRNTGTQTTIRNTKTASRRLFGHRDAVGIVWNTGTPGANYYFFIASYWRTTSFASSLSAWSPLTSVNTRSGPPCAIISWIFTASSSSA